MQLSETRMSHLPNAGPHLELQWNDDVIAMARNGRFSDEGHPLKLTDNGIA
jgi:hypothetical protein